MMFFVSFCFFILLGGIYSIPSTVDNSYCGAGICGAYNPEWMMGIRDDASVIDLSVPGTHESATYHCNGAGQEWTECQSMEIDRQLLEGIRFFDLRVGCNGNIHHNKKQTPYWIQHLVRQEYKTFLEKYPTEFIFVRVKASDDLVSGCDWTGYWIPEIIEPLFEEAALEGYLYVNTESNYFPKVSEVRGKIVVLREYNFINSKFGMHYISQFNIQDEFNTKQRENRWNVARLYFKNHVGPKQEESKGFINYLSASNAYNPRDNAKYINVRFKEWLFNLYNNWQYSWALDWRMGIVPLDYPGRDLINMIIARQKWKNIKPDLEGKKGYFFEGKVVTFIGEGAWYLVLDGKLRKLPNWNTLAILMQSYTITWLKSDYKQKFVMGRDVYYSYKLYCSNRPSVAEWFVDYKSDSGNDVEIREISNDNTRWRYNFNWETLSYNSKDFRCGSIPGEPLHEEFQYELQLICKDDGKLHRETGCKVDSDCCSGKCHTNPEGVKYCECGYPLLSRSWCSNEVDAGSDQCCSHYDCENGRCCSPLGKWCTESSHCCDPTHFCQGGVCQQI